MFETGKLRQRIASPRLGAESEAFGVWLDPAAGSCKCCVLTAAVAPLVPPNRVQVPVFAGERCTQGPRNGDDFYVQQELAVKTQLDVAFKLTLIYNGVMVCFGTQCSFAPYLKSCGKPNSI